MLKYARYAKHIVKLVGSQFIWTEDPERGRVALHDFSQERYMKN